MLQIDTTNHILLDGQQTGLAIAQKLSGTVIFTPENRLTGAPYREHPMPHPRYATSCDAPASGVPGRTQLETDVRALLVSTNAP